MKQDNWQTHFKEAFKDSTSLLSFLEISYDQQAALKTLPYPVFVPRELAKKIKQKGPDSALWKQFVPSMKEEDQSGLKDPIGDQVHQKKGQLIHRYQNRALFLPTTKCPVICRYCFRKNELYDSQFHKDFSPQFNETLHYLKNHPEIEEIIFSGGDPLVLSDQKIWQYAQAFREAGIKMIRFHTRMPVVLWQRIDAEFIALMKKLTEIFEVVTIAIHVNHSEELSDKLCRVSQELAKLPLQLISQTVLLKSINDEAQELKKLFTELVKMRIRPYYLHHPDPVAGGQHFCLNLAEGRKIYHQLRRISPGWALPHYIIDISEGRGKTLAYNSESWDFSGEFIDKDGEIAKMTSEFR